MTLRSVLQPYEFTVVNQPNYDFDILQGSVATVVLK